VRHTTRRWLARAGFRVTRIPARASHRRVVWRTTARTVMSGRGDLIDDAARAIIIFDVREIKDYAHDLADVIVRMAAQLQEIVKTLQKPKNITQRLVEIHRLENEGDDTFHAAIAELFHEEKDPLTVLKWKEVYEKLEAAIDRCENVANIIESVIIKQKDCRLAIANRKSIEKPLGR